MSRNLCRSVIRISLRTRLLHAAVRSSLAQNPKTWFSFRPEFRRILRSPGAAPGDRPKCRTSLSCWPGSARPRPLDVASQTARALFSLRESLIRGEFAPGERMAELPLVARLGVSRTPIRLALEQLAHMGLLDVSANGGFTVRGYTATEALDAIEIRGVLEGTAARLRSGTARGRRRDCDAAPSRRGDGSPRAPDARLLRHLHGAQRGVSLRDHRPRQERDAEARVQHAVSLPFASPSAMVFPTSGLAYADDALAIAKEHHRGIVEAIAEAAGDARREPGPRARVHRPARARDGAV